MSSFSPIQTNHCAARRPFAGWPIAIALATITIATSGAMAQNVARFPRRLPKLPSIGRNQSPHPAVVRVQANDDRGSSHGSGTLVDVQGDYALVVTNWHVVRDAPQRVSVTFPHGFHTAAQVIRMDKDWDLAALIVWNPGGVTPVAIADRAPQRGDTLTIAGYGSGNYRAVSGRCTQYVAPGINFPYEMVEVSVQARHGDSGGPIFNEQGELAGVLFGAAPGTTSGSYAGRVQQFLLTAWPDLGVPRDTMIAAKPARTTPHSRLRRIHCLRSRLGKEKGESSSSAGASASRIGSPQRKTISRCDVRTPTGTSSPGPGSRAGNCLGRPRRSLAVSTGEDAVCTDRRCRDLVTPDQLFT